MAEVDEITQWLKNEGLDAEWKATFWEITFNFDGRVKTAIVLQPPDDEYLLIASQIYTEALSEPLEALPVERLVSLIRLASDEGVLAKLTYIPDSDGPAYFATSACSTENPTGKKLRRRIEACARLAVTIEKHLEGAVPPSAPAAF